MKIWLSVTSLFLALGVVLGAFGAHGLKDILTPYSQGVYEKAVLYHFVHGLGMFGVCLLPGQGLLAESTTHKILLVFAFGIVIFSGSLYLLAITGMKWLGAITPIGGSAFIVGWMLLAVHVRKDSHESR